MFDRILTVLHLPVRSLLFLSLHCHFMHRLMDYKLRTITTHSQENIEIASMRIQSYATFFNRLNMGEPANVVTWVFRLLISYLSLSSLSVQVASEVVRLFSDMCKNVYIQVILLKQEEVRVIVIHHHEMMFPVLSQPDAGRILTSFYTFLTELLLVKAHPGDLELFAQPLLEELQKYQSNDHQTIYQLCSCVRKITGILRACHKPHHFSALFDIL